MLSLIVAHDTNHAIGRAGTIPWHIPEDLQLFQRETRGGALIMGRKTWQSLPVRPLKGRFNCVVGRTASEGADCVVHNIHDAMDACRAAGHLRIYGIGGARIYADLLPLAHRLVITKVAADTPDADTWFPKYQPNDWVTINQVQLTPQAQVVEMLRTAHGQTIPERA